VVTVATRVITQSNVVLAIVIHADVHVLKAIPVEQDAEDHVDYKAAQVCKARPV